MASDMTPPPPPPPSSSPPPPPPPAVPPPAAPPIDPPPEYLRRPHEPEAPLQVAAQATGGRGFGFVFLAVIALGLFGIAIWYAYEQGVRRGVQMAPPLIKADTSPIRIKPEIPGGMEVPHQDKTVYDRMSGQTKSVEVEKLLPPPENVIEKPLAIVRDADSAATPTQVDKPKLTASETPKLKETVVVEAAKVPEVKQAAKAAAKPEPKPEPVAEAAAKPAVEPTPLVEKKATAPITRATDYLIQIGAYRSPKAAQTGWARLVSANKALLGSLKPIVVRADLGKRGVYHRLRAGPVDGAEAAKALCARLKQRKVGCLVIKP